MTLASAPTEPEAPGTRPNRPNILFIQSDQHNPAVMGCYGDPVVETPNLDRLAARGARLTSAYCASPICVPSRMSLITGRFPHENEVWTNDQSLDSAIPTYAHALGAAGYRPVQIGRMHFNGPDQLHGFAERRVGDHSPNWAGSPRPVDHGALTGTAGPARVSLELSGRGQSAYEVHDEEVTDATVDYLDRFGESRAPGEAVCLSVGLMLPHQPFVARPEDYARYEGRVGLPSTAATPLDDCHPYIRWWRNRTGIEQVTESEAIRARTAYWALVDRLDALIGRILDAVERNGLSDKLIIVYTSDHGDQLGEHGLWWKQTLYEGSARVPALISWPPAIPAGTVIDNPVNQFDLLATVLDAAGAPQLPRSRARSLLGLLNSPETADWHNTAFSEYCMNDDSTGATYSANLGGPDVHSRPGGVQNRMIRSGPWKLNYYHGFRPQLFNLDDDPQETLDLAADTAFAGVRAELTDRVLDGWDPERIRNRMRVLKSEQQILESWASNIDPPDSLRWDLRPEMDYLEPDR